MSPEELRRMAAELTKASHTLSADQAQNCAKFCEVSKAFLHHKAASLVAKSQGRAVLLSYASDSTPTLTGKTVTGSLAMAQGGRRLRFVRKGKQGMEYLMQRAFLRSRDSNGEVVMATLFRDPIPLKEGKGAECCFSAALSFCPTLRSLGHDGVCISHSAFDRALQAPLSRLMGQRSQKYYYDLQQSDVSGVAQMRYLTDWTLSTACVDHDCQNGIKWSLAPFHEGDDLQDLYVVMEALRNSAEQIAQRVPEFVSKYLDIVVDDGDRQATYEYWTAIGVEPEAVEQLTRLKLVWTGTRLQVAADHGFGDEVWGEVSSLLLYLLKWRKFSESRWLTLGVSCSSMAASLSVGLEALVAMVRADEHSSDYHLSGVSRLSSRIKTFCVAGTVASRVSDAVLAEVLEDDRVALRVGELECAMRDEQEWVASMGEHIWIRLASLCGEGMSFQVLRTRCVAAACVAGGYISRRVFREARQMPWSFLHGDVNANLHALLTMPMPVDETSQKLWQLVRLGFNRAALVEAVKLMGDISWSTTSVEQAHGSMATLHRYHPMYDERMLCQRSMVHMMRALFAARDESRGVVHAEKRLAILAKKAPEKLTGRHVYLADCMATLNDMDVRDPQERVEMGRRLMRLHGHRFKALSPSDKAAYDDRAVSLALEKRMALEEEIEELIERRSLTIARNVQEQRQRREVTRVSTCRLSDDDLVVFAAMWESGEFTHAEVAKLREAALESPRPLVAATLRELNEFDGDQQPLPDLPEWAEEVCRHRALFEGCALLFTSGGLETAYAFLFAGKNPMHVALMPLEYAERNVDDSSEQEEGGGAPAFDDVYDHEFTWGLGEFSSEQDVEHDEQTDDVLVLPHLQMLPGRRLVSDADPIPLLAFISKVAAKVVGTGEVGARATTKPRVDVSVLEEIPWLAQFLDAKEMNASHQRTSSSHKEKQKLPQVLDRDSVEKVFDVLEEKRRNWQWEGRDTSEDFVTEIRGGNWADLFLGQRADCMRGKAKSRGAKVWAQKYGMQKSSDYKYSKYRDEAITHGLAVAWCEQMQHYYNLYLQAGDVDFVYSQEDQGSWTGCAQLERDLERAGQSHPGYLRYQKVRAEQLPRAPRM